jgi:hypothetical protein
MQFSLTLGRQCAHGDEQHHGRHRQAELLRQYSGANPRICELVRKIHCQHPFGGYCQNFKAAVACEATTTAAAAEVLEGVVDRHRGWRDQARLDSRAQKHHGSRPRPAAESVDAGRGTTAEGQGVDHSPHPPVRLPRRQQRHDGPCHRQHWPEGRPAAVGEAEDHTERAVQADLAVLPVRPRLHTLLFS